MTSGSARRRNGGIPKAGGTDGNEGVERGRRESQPMSSERGSADQPQGRMDRNAAREGDEAAFNRLVEPHLEELLTAARMEVHHRVALGDLGQDDLAPEELVGETLVRAWSDRGRRPALLG